MGRERIRGRALEHSCSKVILSSNPFPWLQHRANAPHALRLAGPLVPWHVLQGL